MIKSHLLVAPNSKIGGMANGPFREHWWFRRGLGAALAMIRPALTTLPRKTLLNQPNTSCPMYTPLLTSKRDTEAVHTIGASDDLATTATASVCGRWLAWC